VKLPDGRECRRRAGPFGGCDQHEDPARRPRVPACLDPLGFGDYYLAWLRERGREPVVPDDLREFLHWWRGLPTVHGIELRWSMDQYQLRNWWLVWRRHTGREVLIPFDLSLFCEWWKVA
jgi:hypothetical protein